MIGITKFNPLRAKADSFGFRRGYFLKSKKMELAEVKKYFENAEFVETVSFNEKRKVDLDSIWVDCDLDFWSIEKETGYIFYLGSKKKGFAKILTTKEPSFSITKDQLRQLTDSKVKEWFPEVFKVNLEVGKWYSTQVAWASKILVCVTSIQDNCFSGYGLDNKGKWLNDGGWELSDPKEATNEEVFEVLKNEAVKRGFVNGVFFRSAVSGDNYKFTNIYFTEATDMAWSKNGGVIFDNGKWANVIEIKKMTKIEIEKQLGYKIEII